MSNCFAPAHILLPDESIPLSSWACVACDQFTSQPEYWQQAEGLTYQLPSTLHIILPEQYLGRPDEPQRIKNIHATMEDYAKNVLTRSVDGFIYLERTLMDGSIRAGLLGAVDLEAYSYKPEELPEIRPSESTVVSRIPPRLAVRRGAKLESPHVMMLVDDAEKTLIEPVGQRKASLKKVYDGDLMLEGGHITGWAVEQPEDVVAIVSAMNALGSQETFDAKYPAAAGQKPLTMAVGDGNHSLATAKAYWEEIKATLPESEWADHPARWCLVEVCNVHSPAIQIEPIHRVLFGTTTAAVLLAWAEYAAFKGTTLCPNEKGDQTVHIVTHLGEMDMGLKHPHHPLTVGSVEGFLEKFLKDHIDCRIDYIHGEQTARDLAAKGGIAFLMPDFEKSDLFKGVVLGGVLPRKTFSMGHPQEKRYYLECRSICEK